MNLQNYFFFKQRGENKETLKKPYCLLFICYVLFGTHVIELEL